MFIWLVCPFHVRGAIRKEAAMAASHCTIISRSKRRSVLRYISSRCCAKSSAARAVEEELARSVFISGFFTGGPDRCDPQACSQKRKQTSGRLLHCGQGK